MSQIDNRKTKSLLINPEFQLKFISYILAVAGFTFVIFLTAKFIFFARLRSYLLEVGIAPDHVIFNFLATQDRVLTIILLIAALIEMVLLLVVGIVLSHKVAGPLYRLTQDLQGIVDGGERREIKFRKGDFFPEVAAVVSRVLMK